MASRPHVTSADAWEAVHRATGLPLVADSYTRIHRLEAVTEENRTAFDALCRVGDELQVRWRLDGEFLLGRSTSYFWDRLKEVPNRHLHRWQQTRRDQGSLPLEQVLEIASLSDAHLDSMLVGKAIQHCWGIHEWGLVGSGLPGGTPERYRRFSPRSHYRLLAALTPGQLRQALTTQGLAVPAMHPAQQQEVARIDPLLLPTTLFAGYVPDGWYTWSNSLPPGATQSTHQFWHQAPVLSERTLEAALTAARKLQPGIDPVQIGHQEGTLAVWYVTADGRRLVELNRPKPFVPRVR